MTPRQHATLLRRCERDYLAALRCEEHAPTLASAWRAAAASERALRRVQLVRAGLPLPVVQPPRTARNRALGGFAALATVGRTIARAFARRAALARAQAAAALARAARKVARAARAALRRALVAVVSLLPLTAAATPAPHHKDTPMTTLLNDRTSTPAAACPRCGGWTAYGGCSQHASSLVPVHGRTGCVCLGLAGPAPATLAAYPAVLGGYPVRAVRETRGGGFVLLVERRGASTPWVTACWSPGWDSWEHGDYFKELPDAVTHYLAR